MVALSQNLIHLLPVDVQEGLETHTAETEIQDKDLSFVHLQRSTGSVSNRVLSAVYKTIKDRWEGWQQQVPAVIRGESEIWQKRDGADYWGLLCSGNETCPPKSQADCPEMKDDECTSKTADLKTCKQVQSAFF